MRRILIAVGLALGCGSPEPRPVPARPAHVPPVRLDASSVAPPEVAAEVAPDARAPVVHAVCVPPRFAGNLVHFSATETAASVCLREDRPGMGAMQTLCFDVDLATGAQLPSSATPGEPPVVAPPFTVQDDARGVRICKQRRCTRLALKPIPPWDDGPDLDYGITFSADGTRAIGQFPGAREVNLLDTKTGRQLALLDVAPCTSAFAFLDDTIWIQGSQCNWIDEASYLLDKDGAPLALLHQVDPKFMRPVRFEGATWVVPATHGDGFVMFDATSGEVKGTVSGLPRFDEDRCRHCTPVSMKGPRTVMPVTRTPSGTLLVFSAGIAVIDRTYSAVDRHLPLGVCP